MAMENILQTSFETISDKRGEIRKIAQNVDVLSITSKKGSKRASHHHKTSSHTCLLRSGSMTYYERSVGSNKKPTKLEIQPGDYFYTGPLIDHLMVFNEDSVFDCYSFGSRKKEDYENDLVRSAFDLEEEYKNWKYETIHDCRFCGSEKLVERLSLGDTPLANNLVKDTAAEKFSLTLVQCETCGCVQLKETVNPRLLFSNYLYSSSQSGSLKKHFEGYAREVIDYCNPKTVLEIGGNDGVLAIPLQKAGCSIINVEPATNLAEVSKNNGIETINDFFSEKLAETLNPVDLVVSNNCLAHIPNIHDILKGIVKVLKPGGWLVFENAYWLDSVKNLYFDQIYHEHIFFHLVKPLRSLLACYGLEIKKIERNNQQGGSIRVFCLNTGYKFGEASSSVQSLIDEEIEAGLYNGDAFQNLNDKIKEKSADLNKKLLELKSENKTIAGYGYPAKATTLLSYFRIAPFLDYIVEDSKLKIGYQTPVGNLPIVGKEELKSDVCLILAWNYAELIKTNNPNFKGEWIVAM